MTDRVHAHSGSSESKSVDFSLGFEELSFFDADNRRTVEPADYTVLIGGSSTADQIAEFQAADVTRRPIAARYLRFRLSVSQGNDATRNRLRSVHDQIRQMSWRTFSTGRT